MSNGDSKTLIRRYFEVMPLNGERAKQAELLAPAFVFHDPAFGALTGREAFLDANDAFITAFPDLSVTIHDLIAEGDRVAARWTWRGTHRAEFMGVPATGTQVAVDMLEIFRVSDGRIREVWLALDTLGLMRQLGITPDLEPAGA